jgi:hypothetical protein
MKSKNELIINLNVDWRMLAVLLVTAGLLIFAYSAVSAQSDEPLTTNSVQAEPAESVAQPPPVTAPDPSQAQEGDLLTTNGEWVSSDSVGAAPSSEATAAGIGAQAASGALFYLTDANYYTDQVLTACASGYHMASLWEILDVSNLVYAYDHPAAHTKTDSGFGPPSYWHGWVRTGQDSSGSSTTGIGNCLNWSTRSGSNNGVSVRLSRTWETAPGDIFTWDANTFDCSIIGPVWCIQD